MDAWIDWWINERVNRMRDSQCCCHNCRCACCAQAKEVWSRLHAKHAGVLERLGLLHSKSLAALRARCEGLRRTRYALSGRIQHQERLLERGDDAVEACVSVGRPR